MGEFNTALIKYSSETNTGDCYDLLCSNSFRPLILQSTGVTSKSATLIDNIFINSQGGNLTSSISDHFFQFCHTDISQTTSNRKRSKFARDFLTFNKREFGDELSKANRTEIIDTNVGTDLSYNNFYRKIENILDYMAPYRKLTQKELKREQMPWITRGILVSTRIRDTLYKTWTEEKDSQFKDRIVALYKSYRNMNITLLRRSKANYFSSFSSKTKITLKKHGTVYEI